MNVLRYAEIDKLGALLTPEEVAAGWHFCPDWDEALVGPPLKLMMDACTCALPHEETD